MQRALPAFGGSLALVPCSRRGRNRPGHGRRSPLTVSQAADPRSTKQETERRATATALEGAIATINSLLSMGDFFGSMGGQAPKPKQPGAGGEGGMVTGRLKRVPFSAKAKTVLDIPQVEDSPLRFDAYLSLPPEEYSLLDPKWIQRDGPDLFKLSVPLGDLYDEYMGMGTRGTAQAGGLAAIVPSVFVRSSLDPATQTVTLTGDRASLGQPTLDQWFSLGFEVKMKWGGGPPSAWVPPPKPILAAVETAVVTGDVGGEGSGSGDGVVRAETALIEMEVVRGPEMTFPEETSTALSVSQQDYRYPQQQAAAPAAWVLVCSVNVSGSVDMPPPASSLPRPLLGTASALVVKFVLQSILPRFAELLAADYRRWARGDKARGSTGVGELSRRKGAAGGGPEMVSPSEAKARAKAKEEGAAAAAASGASSAATAAEPGAATTTTTSL